MTDDVLQRRTGGPLGHLEVVSERPERFVHATPTIEDVGRHAGVSRQTVSNVLNAPHRVRPETIVMLVSAKAT